MSNKTSIKTTEFQKRINKGKKVDLVIPRAYSSILGSIYEFSLNGVSYRFNIDGKTKNKVPQEIADYWNNYKLPAILDHDFGEVKVDTIYS